MVTTMTTTTMPMMVMMTMTIMKQIRTWVGTNTLKGVETQNELTTLAEIRNLNSERNCKGIQVTEVVRI
jgi:hypothetical protein